jgi:hypothetical protein
MASTHVWWTLAQMVADPCGAKLRDAGLRGSDTMTGPDEMADADEVVTLAVPEVVGAIYLIATANRQATSAA